jgi:hypothetical protein
MAVFKTSSGLRNEFLLDSISKSGSLVVSKTSENSYQFNELNDKDGVHPEVWKAYCKAKAVLLEPINHNQNTSG